MTPPEALSLLASVADAIARLGFRVRPPEIAERGGYFAVFLWCHEVYERNLDEAVRRALFSATDVLRGHLREGRCSDRSEAIVALCARINAALDQLLPPPTAR